MKAVHILLGIVVLVSSLRTVSAQEGAVPSGPRDAEGLPRGRELNVRKRSYERWFHSRRRVRELLLPGNLPEGRSVTRLGHTNYNTPFAGYGTYAGAVLIEEVLNHGIARWIDRGPEHLRELVAPASLMHYAALTATTPHVSRWMDRVLTPSSSNVLLQSGRRTLPALVTMSGLRWIQGEDPKRLAVSSATFLGMSTLLNVFFDPVVLARINPQSRFALGAYEATKLGFAMFLSDGEESVAPPRGAGAVGAKVPRQGP